MEEQTVEKRRLGKGLDALLGITDEPVAQQPVTTEVMPGSQTELPLDSIQHNPYQPRKAFDEDELAALSASVRSHGILQPLVVRQIDGNYQLVAGERRLRAAQEAGLSTVPVRLVDFNDQEVIEAALAENIHRTDLNAIEKAQGFKDYLDRFGVNHEQLAQRLGLARSTITNLVNLLELAPEVQDALRTNQLTEAHAKILKGVKDHQQQVALYRQIVAQGLSVKATEQLVRERKEEAEPKPEKPAAPEKTNHVRSIEDELRTRFATPVEIRLKDKEKGQVILHFENNDDFTRLMDMLRS